MTLIVLGSLPFLTTHLYYDMRIIRKQCHATAHLEDIPINFTLIIWESFTWGQSWAGIGYLLPIYKSVPITVKYKTVTKIYFNNLFSPIAWFISDSVIPHIGFNKIYWIWGAEVRWKRKITVRHYIYVITSLCTFSISTYFHFYQLVTEDNFISNLFSLSLMYFLRGFTAVPIFLPFL